MIDIAGEGRYRDEYGCGIEGVHNVIGIRRADPTVGTFWLLPASGLAREPRG